MVVRMVTKMMGLSSLLVVLLLLFSITPSPVSSLQYLRRGSSLFVEKPIDLVSKNNVFSCGFYQAETNACSFSIWYSKSNNTLVWTANQDHPVHGRRSRPELWKDGTMVLVDSDNSIVWSTKTISDTLLPGQPITKYIKLVSARYENSTKLGFYNLFFHNDNVLNMSYDGPDISSIYLRTLDASIFAKGRTTYNNSRYGVLDDMDQFISSDWLGFAASDMNTSGSNKRRLTIGFDENIRLYILNETTGRWMVTWQAIAVPCRVHGLCGRNNICTDTLAPKCSCPRTYALVDPFITNRDVEEARFRQCNKKMDGLLERDLQDHRGGGGDEIGDFVDVLLSLQKYGDSGVLLTDDNR